MAATVISIFQHSVFRQSITMSHAGTGTLGLRSHSVQSLVGKRKLTDNYTTRPKVARDACALRYMRPAVHAVPVQHALLMIFRRKNGNSLRTVHQIFSNFFLLESPVSCGHQQQFNTINIIKLITIF